MLYTPSYFSKTIHFHFPSWLLKLMCLRNFLIPFHSSVPTVKWSLAPFNRSKPIALPNSRVSFFFLHRKKENWDKHGCYLKTTHEPSACSCDISYLANVELNPTKAANHIGYWVSSEDFKESKYHSSRVLYKNNQWNSDISEENTGLWLF